MHRNSPRLTLILPLMGRHLHTLRFFHWANSVKLPYPIIVADGLVHPAIARLMNDAKRHFPHLTITYRQLPDDTCFRDYYRKLAEAVAQARTDYVMYIDNDDFPVVPGLERCMDFLDRNPDFASCGAGIASVSVFGKGPAPLGQATGHVCALEYRYALPDDILRDRSSDSATDRVLDVMKNFPATFYYVYRTPVLQTIFAESLQLDFSDLIVFEAFFAVRSHTLGKSKGLPSCIAYIRQKGSSMPGTWRKDWVGHLVRSRFTEDLGQMVSRISHLAAEADGTDPEAIAEQLRELYGNELRARIIDKYNPRPLRTWLRKSMPAWLWRLRKRRYGLLRGDIARIFEHLRRDGASPDDIVHFESELRAIMKAIEGKHLTSFVEANAPELMADA